MTIAVGTNVSSLSAQRALAKADLQFERSSRRLSSGQRINSAADDAAGLAIADSLSARGRIYTQGFRNIGDGLSLLNIAQGALSELSSLVTRQIELSEQAANGTYRGTQRGELNREANALRKEYNRILESTQFNGIELFSGKNGSIVLQHGFGLVEATGVNVEDRIGVRSGDGTFNGPTFVGLTTGSSP